MKHCTRPEHDLFRKNVIFFTKLENSYIKLRSHRQSSLSAW